MADSQKEAQKIFDAIQYIFNSLFPLFIILRQTLEKDSPILAESIRDARNLGTRSMDAGFKVEDKNNLYILQKGARQVILSYSRIEKITNDIKVKQENLIKLLKQLEKLLK